MIVSMRFERRWSHRLSGIVWQLRTFMIRRIVFICVWMAVFSFGGAILLGVASGVYFYMSSSAGAQPSEQTISWLGMSWAFAPMVLGLVGLILGILGFLPGTRRRTS